jgi:RNA polymerase sigma-70 factor, ECF subfamily
MLKSQPAIIAAWQQGDEQAVHAVFDTYYPQAVRFAVLSGLSVEAAQDCAQEAFVHAFQRRHQLRDPPAFPLWFHRIVTRHVLDTLRGRKRNQEQPLEVIGELSEDWERRRLPQPDEEAISGEERAHLWQAVQLLPPHYRVPLVLHYYSDFSFREVATLMGKREGTIRVIIHRALQQLRTLSREQSWGVHGQVNQYIEVGQPRGGI